MDIFVSYTTRDHYIDRELLENISNIISHYGNCYIDILHNDASDKQHHVELMLSQANLLLLIASSSIAESEWVQWELTEARRRCIPIIVVQAKPDKNETLNILRSKAVAENLLASALELTFSEVKTPAYRSKLCFF